MGMARAFWVQPSASCTQKGRFQKSARNPERSTRYRCTRGTQEGPPGTATLASAISDLRSARHCGVKKVAIATVSKSCPNGKLKATLEARNKAGDELFALEYDFAIGNGQARASLRGRPVARS